MDKEIIPTIWEEEFPQVLEKLRAVEPFAERVLFDIMDGRFVRKYSWDDPEDLKTVKLDLSFDAHLYMKDPEKQYLEWVKGGIQRIFFHYEALEDKPEVEDDYGRKMGAIEAFIREVHNYKREVGIALLPDTDWQPIIDYMRDVDFVLILTAKNWIKRRKFLEETVEKVESLRKFYEDLDIAVEGCLDEEAFDKIHDAGANIFYIRDYFWEGDNPEQRYKKLDDKISEE